MIKVYDIETSFADDASEIERLFNRAYNLGARRIIQYEEALDTRYTFVMQDGSEYIFEFPDSGPPFPVQPIERMWDFEAQLSDFLDRVEAAL